MPYRGGFQKIEIPETTIDETREILMGLQDRYEEYHDVKYTEEALRVRRGAFRKIHQ